MTDKKQSRKKCKERALAYDARFAADIPWEDLPLRTQGRPKATEPRATAMKPHSIKIPEDVWVALKHAAHKSGTTAGAFLSGLAREAVLQNEVDSTVKRLQEEGYIASPSI